MKDVDVKKNVPSRVTAVETAALERAVASELNTKQEEKSVEELLNANSGKYDTRTGNGNANKGNGQV